MALYSASFTALTQIAGQDSRRAISYLTFMGGLSLSSPNRDFGALSGMEILPDGTVLFIADTGHWLSARLVEEGGRLVGVADARMAPILDAAGDEANQKGAAAPCRAASSPPTACPMSSPETRPSQYTLLTRP